MRPTCLSVLRALMLSICVMESQAASVTIDRQGILVIDGARVFPIGFTRAPAPDTVAPGGGDAYSTLASNGSVFHRCGVGPGQWGANAEVTLDRMLDRSAESGILCAIYIADLQAIGPNEQTKALELRRVVRKYRDHPGLGFWKGADEPEWGRIPVASVQRFYDIVHELDSHHPVWITQAPRGTIDSLRAYNSTYDIGAIDIYPIGYPPGLHSHLPNKNISVVGDYAQWMREISGDTKPFWMVLQIAWSGVIQPGRTLRFPTFPDERYMSYQSIIHGARGLLYFGGDLSASLNERDRDLGWNWTFYGRVLHPLLQEFGPNSPLHPALIAPHSQLRVRLQGADDIEFCVREADTSMFLIAAKREGDTVSVTFSGLPLDLSSGDVLFEQPRTVSVSNGEFKDWFGPNEVHVYRFRRANTNSSTPH